MKKAKLGTKITILFIVIVLLSVGLSGVLSALSQDSIIEKQLNYSTQQNADALAQQIDSFLQSKAQVLEALSEISDIKNLDLEKQKDILKATNSIYNEFAVMFIADMTGQQTCKSDDSKVANISDRAYFTQVTSEQKTIFSDVIISNTTGKSAIVIVTPIKDNSGKMIALLGATLDLSKLEEYSSKIVLGKTGYAYITDRNGIILAHKDQAFVEEQKDVSDISITQKALEGSSGTMSYTYENQKRFGAYTFVPTTGWGIVVQQYYDEAYAQVYTVIFDVIIVAIIILIIATIISFIFSKIITRPLIILNKSAKDLAEGKIGQPILVKSSDEIGQLARSFEYMRNSLKDMVEQIGKSSDEVKESTDKVLFHSQKTQGVATQITDAVSDLALGSDEQARNLQSTAFSMTNIAKSIDAIADNSNQSYQSSTKASKLVQNGAIIVKEQDQKMLETNQAVDQVSEIIYSLHEKTDEIGRIIEVIQSVTKQTNLLALNAAIEAARAGEQGKGFAVVADEVRQLAEQSQASTGEIHTIINSIQSTTQNAVDRVKFAKTTIEEQNKAVENTSKIFDDILKIVGVIANEVQEISHATSTVREESESILQNIESISAVSEEAAASTEEVTASTEEQTASIEYVVQEIEKLNELAENLQATTKFFHE